VTNLKAYNFISTVPQLAVMDADAKFVKQQWLETITYPWRTYRDPDLRRQFQKHSVLGYAALEREKFAKVLATLKLS
jgi:hypothetical protein